MKTAADLENERRARDGLSPIICLFPGMEGKALANIKKFSASVCSKAEITGVRIHDLRHTHASILASLGLSLPITGPFREGRPLPGMVSEAERDGSVR
jgi:integrase